MKYTPEYIPGTKVEVVVKDEQVEELITNILNRLGNTSGKIFVTDVPTVVDIRTSKRGESALYHIDYLSNSKDGKNSACRHLVIIPSSNFEIKKCKPPSCSQVMFRHQIMGLSLALLDCGLKKVEFI